MNSEFISWKDLEFAYKDFLRHKRSTSSAYQYMQISVRDIPLLKQELEDGTYTISDSIAFCVTRPKLREVFAASPRDRVVHHLLIYKFYDMFEQHSIEESFNCRRDKGNSAMSNYVHYALQSVGKDGWVCKADIQGCFMSIDKDILWNMLYPEIIKWCQTHSDMSSYTDRWVWLWKMVVYHRPEQKCTIHGDASLFDKLPPNKTLFKSNGKGLAIGNLTSQILANFYFSKVDNIVSTYMKSHKSYYARYMDDIFIASHDKSVVLEGVYKFRSGIQHLNLRLHPNKFYLQHANKSISTIGQTHINGRIYSSNRTVYNAFSSVERLNHLAETRGPQWVKDNIMYITSVINSYYGFFRTGKTYAIRYNLWNSISSDIKHYIYSTKMRKVSVISKYRPLRRISRHQSFIRHIHSNKHHDNSRHNRGPKI